MSLPVILMHGVFGFSLLQDKPNGLPYTFPLEALYTPQGFIFPLSIMAMNLSDYIERGDVAFRGNHLPVRGVILSSSGKLREISISWEELPETGEDMFTKSALYLPFDKSSVYVRSMASKTEEIFLAYTKVARSAAHVVELYGQNHPAIVDQYQFLKAEVIVAGLIERGYTEEFSLSVRSSKAKDSFLKQVDAIMGVKGMRPRE